MEASDSLDLPRDLCSHFSWIVQLEDAELIYHYFDGMIDLSAIFVGEKSASLFGDELYGLPMDTNGRLGA